jgi:polar amino acid transport system substrate-binding protein
MKKLSLLLAVILLFALTAACSGEKDKPVLTMATNAEFPPFEYINDAGEYDGFDVAFAKAIAEKLGMELKIDNMNFDSIVTAVQTGLADVGIAAISDKAERREFVDFTIPYFSATLVVIVPQDSDIGGLADLEQARIAVQEGTTSDIFCEDELPDAAITRFKRAPDTVLELKSGRVDAIVIDNGVAGQFISDNPDLKILPETLAEEEYVIAVGKNNKELLDKINKAIQELKDSGEFKKIYDNFFES